MVTNVQRLRLFLAGASDVNPERKIVHEVVESWNRGAGQQRGWRVDVFDYTKNVAPRYGGDGQKIINEAAGNMRSYAFFVGITKHRFGTPTPRAPSGTVEEFRRAVRAYQSTGRLQIMLYFSDASLPAPHTKEKLQQKTKVMDFRKQVQSKSFYIPYPGEAEFRRLFSEHFAGSMEKQIKVAVAAKRRAAALGSANKIKPATRRPAKTAARPKAAGASKPKASPKPTRKAPARVSTTKAK